jgi:hypothetical protein
MIEHLAVLHTQFDDSRYDTTSELPLSSLALSSIPGTGSPSTVKAPRVPRKAHSIQQIVTSASRNVKFLSFPLDKILISFPPLSRSNTPYAIHYVTLPKIRDMKISTGWGKKGDTFPILLRSRGLTCSTKNPHSQRAPRSRLTPNTPRQDCNRPVIDD